MDKGNDSAYENRRKQVFFRIYKVSEGKKSCLGKGS
jgi:hypothetical protein